MIDLATRERMTVVDTPGAAARAGWKIIDRRMPVGDDHRSYGGFLPINDD